MKQLKKYILICTSTNIYTGHHLNWGSSFNKYKLFSFRRNQMFGKLKRCSKTNGLIGNWEWFGLWVNVAILIWKSSSFHLHINQNERVSSGFVDPSNGKWNSNCISCYAVQNWYTSLWERSVFFIIPEKIKKKKNIYWNELIVKYNSEIYEMNKRFLEWDWNTFTIILSNWSRKFVVVHSWSVLPTTP